MDELKWELLTEISGRIDAEMLKSYLEAEGIEVQLFQEGAGQDLYPVTFGPLAMVQVFVPNDKIDDARSILESYNSQGTDSEAEEEKD
jgi:Putative prokaryotic signal transducing protein